MTATPHVAFLGLGAIGTPMAEHVAQHFPLTVWNRTREKAETFVASAQARAAEQGRSATSVTIAATPAEAARASEIIITCLPASPEVEDVLFEKDGLVHGLQPGSILVDCTSGDPTRSRRIADRLRAQGVDFIDAPVSGGVVGAQNAQLTVMCGGASELLERVRPVLATFGSKIVLCGDVGCGHALKAVNNALLAVHIWSTAEGLAMLEKLGVDPTLALDVINASSGRSNSSMNLFPERVLTRAFPKTFRLALLDKDVRIASHIAKETRTPAEMIDLTSKLFTDAHLRLGNQADHVEAVKVVEQRAGAEIKAH